MADLVLTLGVPHTPLLWQNLTEPPPSDLVEVAASFRQFREALAQAQPDMLVLIGSDHLRSIVTANMPAFMVGKGESHRGTVPSEVRAFGLPRLAVPGDPSLAREIVGQPQLNDRIDFAFSDEMWLDHSFVVPLLYLRPELDLPVVPIHTNTNAPPIPTATRFLELGRYLREAILGWQVPERVAVIASGHVAFELGGPRQFSGHSPDPGFDAEVVAALFSADTTALVELGGYQRMHAAGNLTFQFLNFLACYAAAGEVPATSAVTVPSRFGDEPFFRWGGEG